MGGGGVEARVVWVVVVDYCVERVHCLVAERVGGARERCLQQWCYDRVDGVFGD